MRTTTTRILSKVLGITMAILCLSAAARAQTTGELGRLKVCKVAGPGVPVGTTFTFTADSALPFTVVAGPGSGGYCSVGPAFPVGSFVTVTETLPSGTQVTSITVAPSRWMWTFGAGAIVQIGSGVTELTFTDKRTGYIEICKRRDGPAGGSFMFYLNNGALGPFTVPAGSCSPAIEVPAGTVTINEVLSFGVHLIGCSTIPAANQINCNTAAGISTVNVAAGDISTQTIAFMTNQAGHDGGIDDSTDSTGSTERH